MQNTIMQKYQHVFRPNNLTKKTSALHSSNSVNKFKYNGLLTSLVIDFEIGYEAFSREVLFIVVYIFYSRL